jgi:glycosyltransferase involved in cell wall biosynthesis
MPKPVIFVSFAPTIGGVATHEALHISYISKMQQVVLVGEKIDFVLEGIGHAAIKNFVPVRLNVWSNPIQTWLQWIKIFANHKPAVVVYNNPAVMVKLAPIILLELLRGASIIAIVHSGAFKEGFKRYPIELISSVGLMFATELVFVSNYTKNHWLDRYPWLKIKNVRIVPNGVPDEASIVPKSHPSGILQIGFVGRLSFEKNPQKFCEIAQFCKKVGADVAFHVFGDGPMLKQLLIHKDIIEFHGFQPQEKIYSKIDLLVVTSPIENCPYAVLEAKSWGIPAITPNCGGLPEIICGNFDGILLDNTMVESFTSAILYVQKNYERFSRAARSSASRFTVAQTGRELWSPYLEAIA